MIKKLTLLTGYILLTAQFLVGQSIEDLRKEIEQVLAEKTATVGVAIKGVNPQDTISINGDLHLPMQSVFKFHLALAALHQVDKGKLNFNDSIAIDRAYMDRYSHLWSPLRKKYPNGAKVPLPEIIQYSVALSDNVGCDLLFKLVGGTDVVQSFFQKIGVKDIAIKHTEIIMQANWDLQYANWTTAKAANQVLQLFFENDKLLSDESYDFLLDVLKGAKTGKKKIRGCLPKDAIVAHKTGTSGKNTHGLTGASNDIGIVYLPDESYFYLSVLVSDSMEDSEANQKIIADIAKLAWDYFKQ